MNHTTVEDVLTGDSVVDVLRYRAELNTNELAYSFLLRGEALDRSVSFSALHNRALSIADELRSHARRQSRALMVYASGLEFIEAFWGTLYAGLVAVPAYPPKSSLHGGDRLKAIVDDCRPELILCSSEYFESVEKCLEVFRVKPRIVVTDTIIASELGGFRFEQARPNDVALLQYSSGSTATPKGIMVSHGNIMANQLMIKEGFGHDSSSTFVGWLPFFHDMGLFGNIIQPLFIGAHGVLMSPLSFLQKPARWLRAISDYNAHTSGGPNFGYDYCVRRVKENDCQGIDLRSWKIAFNGAEKPRKETMSRFAEAFSELGFEESDFYPCYGMAETVLFVTGRNKIQCPNISVAAPETDESASNEGSPSVYDEHQEHVSSGHTWGEQKVLIVDPLKLKACPEGCIGEVWIQGPNVALGYWEKVQLTEETFGARLENGQHGAFLRTGDLGFQQGDELFVVGRIKDLIIVRGRNYFAEDIEALLGSFNARFDSGNCAVFSVERNDTDSSVEEQIVVFLEYGKHKDNQESLREIGGKIYQAIASEFGISVGEIFFLKKGSIPKTSSGKIQRYRCRESYQNGSLSFFEKMQFTVASSCSLVVPTLREGLAVAGESERLNLVLESIVEGVARLVDHDLSKLIQSPSTRVLDLGLDSIRTMAFRQWVEDSYGISLSIEEIWDSVEIGALAKLVVGKVESEQMPVGLGEDTLVPIDLTTIPTSSGQRALYFEYEKEPDSPAYNLGVALRFPDGADSRKLLRSILLLQECHPVLRSTFSRSEGQVVCRLSEIGIGGLKRVNASSLSAMELREAVSFEVAAPFDLSASAIQFYLFEGSTVGDVIVMKIHHIISDLRSIELILRDLSLIADETLTAESRRGLTFDKPELEFARYVNWQDDYLESKRGLESLQYFRDSLLGKIPPTALPFARNQKVHHTGVGAMHRLSLDEKMTRRVRKVAADHGVTSNVLLLYAYGLLLGRFSYEEEVVVGISVEGRQSASSRHAVGYFANVLPIPISLASLGHLGKSLEQIRQLVSNVLERQHYPYSRLVEELRCRKAIAEGDAVRYAFTYGQGEFGDSYLGILSGDETSSIDICGSRAIGYAFDGKMSPFDLTLLVLERDERFDLSLCFNQACFNEVEIMSLAEEYQRIVNSIVGIENVDSKVAIDGKALCEKENLVPKKVSNKSKRKIGPRSMSPVSSLSRPHHPELVDVASSGNPALQRGLYQGPTLPQRYDRSVSKPAKHLPAHMRFRNHALAKFDSVALSFEGMSLSYQELNSRANQIANALSNEGVTNEDIVGLCFSRGFEMVASMIGTLKVGAAYLPLDSKLPSERIEYILDDAGVRVVLTTAATSMPEGDCPFIRMDVDSLWGVMGREGRTFQHVPVEPDQLAYVIYTSGSTGRPKGVAVTHENLSRLLDTSSLCLRFLESDRWALFHSISFDFSVWEIWGALASGSQLTIIPHDVTRSPDRLCDLMRDEQITFLNQTPSAFYSLQHYLTSENVGVFDSLRQIVLGGEKLSPKKLAPWFSLPGCGGVQVSNMYGITETTVHVTFLNLDESAVASHYDSPIGLPLADMSMRVLDTGGIELPHYAMGEFVVAGKGLARGYLKRPRLTAERFVPDAAGEFGGRAYVTGDAGFSLQDRSGYCYCRRVDRQIQIRGFRVEISEIETVLRTIEGIADAHVFCRESNDSPILVACIVEKEGMAFKVGTLRRKLSVQLPEYMIPSRIAFVSQVPVNSNGKLDTDEIFRISASQIANPIEEEIQSKEAIQLVDIFSNALELESLGIDDNFFDLGGDSIRCIRVVSSARELGLDIRVKDVFECQTVRALASLVKERPLLLANEDMESVVGDTDVYPLSYLQQGLLFHNRSGKEYELYVSSLWVSGPYDLSLLENALNYVAQRHPILRSSYSVDGIGEPTQTVRKSLLIPVHETDLQEFDRVKRDSVYRNWVQNQRKSAIEWGVAPLIRVHVHKMRPRLFVVSFVEPFLDGWSVATLGSELLECYSELLAGRELPQSVPLKTSLKEYVIEERKAVDSQKHREFWCNELSRSGKLLLKQAKTEGEESERSIKRLYATFPTKKYREIAAFASMVGVSVKSVLLAVHLRVLNVMGGQEEVSTGLLSNGRLEKDDGESVLGLFLNLLPFLMRLKGGSWKSFVRNVYENEIRLLEYRRFPYLEIQKLNANKPVFDTVFNFTQFHAFRRANASESVRLERLEASDQTYYALTTHFNVDWNSDTLVLAIDYDSQLWSDFEVERLLDYYQSTIEHLLNRPDDRYERSLVEKQVDSMSYLESLPVALSERTGIQELVQENTMKFTDRIAVVAKESCISYGALGEKVDRLARVLRVNGVGSETLVAVSLEREVPMVIGLLAILRAGGAYVPLDRRYPDERLRYILRDSGASIVLTSQAELDRTNRLIESSQSSEGSKVGCFCLCIDDPLTLQDFENEPLPKSYPVENLAYLIYTSGSTGQPKGVAISRGNLNSLVEWAGSAYGNEGLACTLASTSICFDLSCFELFAPLACGGTVNLVSDALDLTSNNGEYGLLTLINTVPSFAKELLSVRPEALSGKIVNLAGEPLSKELTDQLYDVGGARQVFDLYGPSEDTTYSTCSLRKLGDLPNVGVPIAGKKIYVVDSFSELVPSFVSGQIVVAGEGLARGYFGRPRETAGKWLPNPWGSVGERLYQTGDRGRIGADGKLEFIGRADNQIKIRGFRIELGEIETAILALPSVFECAVVVVEEKEAEKILVACVAFEKEEGKAVESGQGRLREKLSATLPGYMIPTRFVSVDTLPKTPNGKTDRKGLLEIIPKQKVPVLKEHSDDPIEEIVAQEYAQLLGLETVRRDVDFFELGGDSLLSMRLVNRLQILFEVKIPIRIFFECSSVLEVSMVVRRKEGIAFKSPVRSEVIESRSTPTGRFRELSFYQESVWLDEQIAGDNPIYTVCSAMKLGGRLNEPALLRSFESLAKRHEALRSRIHYSDDGLIQEVSDEGLDYRRIDLRGETEETRSLRIRDEIDRESVRSFDLENENPLRVILLKVSEDESILVINIHHIVADDWSAKILIEELAQLYDGEHRRESVQLPSLSVSYADFASWQRMSFETGELNGDLEYWRRQLVDLPGEEMLGGLKKVGFERGKRGARRHFTIDDRNVQALKELGRKEGATLFIVLLSAFYWTLRLRTGKQDIVIGSSIANRKPAEWERVVGLFVNTVALRTNLDNAENLSDLIGRVRETVLSAYEHKDFPYGKLIEELNPNRSGQKHSLFDTVFGFWGNSWRNTKSVELEFEPMDVYNGYTKYPLEVQIIEVGGELRGFFEYELNSFDEEVVESLCSEYQQLLEHFSNKMDRLPQSRIAGLSIEKMSQQV